MVQTVVPLPGEYVWYDPAQNGEFDIPVGAQVKTVTTDGIVFRTEEGEVRSYQLMGVD